MDLMIRLITDKEALIKNTILRPFCQVWKKKTDNKIVMKEVIQFSDNFFYIIELIKTVSTASELHLNTRLFSQKISDDISFINSSLDKLTSMLIENNNNRPTPANLRSLLKTRSSFKTALEQLVKDQQEIFINELEIIDYIQNTIFIQNRMIDDIIETIRKLEESEDNSVFITTEEMNLLLKE